VQTTDLTAQLYFAAALRVGADASNTRLLPLACQREPLAPHDQFSQRILLALQALEFIEPELTRSHAEDWLFARDWIRHGFKSLGWRVLRPAPAHLTGYSDELAGLLGQTEYVHETFAQLVALWEDLALAETAEFARLALSRSGYDPRWADDAAPALRQALEHFGVSKVTYLVHISLRSVALTHQRGAVPTSQLGHVLSTSIADYTQRAVAERWVIKGMARDSDRPRSAIASLFADTLTRLGPDYMSEPPSTDALIRALLRRHTVH
jgi:hypothetical protein